MGHAADPYEFLEVFGYKLRTVVGDDSRSGIGEFFPRLLQDDFNISFSHRLAYFPMNNVAAEAVQYAAKIVKRATNVDVRYIAMPVFMGFYGLYEAIASRNRLPHPVHPAEPIRPSVLAMLFF